MLALNDVCKNFGPKQVLQDISFQIERGEILSLLGPSGCGKTTLLNVILGLEQLSGGTISHEQQNISHVSMKDRGFNIVFQDFALFPHLTAYDNIVYGLKNKQKHVKKEDIQPQSKRQNKNLKHLVQMRQSKR